jgi:hypothetical protein
MMFAAIFVDRLSVDFAHAHPCEGRPLTAFFVGCLYAGIPYSLAKLNDALFSNGEGLEPNFASEKLGVSDFRLASLEGLFSQP